MRVVAIVLAAGGATRFGAPKQVALLDARPLLQHPLDALAAAGLRDVVVVLGAEAATVEATIAWRDERRTINEHPGDGLASSLRVGLDAAREIGDADAALVVLGDQPSLRADVIRAVLDAAKSTSVPIVRPRYADDGAPNPVLVRRSAWSLVADLDGDRGLGPLLAERPDLVLEVPVAGTIPDIDTPADLAALEGEVAMMRRTTPAAAGTEAATADRPARPGHVEAAR
jgi:molybdenum cofactor cytidylyltransferase